MNAQQIINDLLYMYECCNAPKLSSEYVHVLNIRKTFVKSWCNVDLLMNVLGKTGISRWTSLEFLLDVCILSVRWLKWL